MNVTTIKSSLAGYEIEHVNIYVRYLTILLEEKTRDGKAKNYWISKISDKEFSEVFKKVALDGLFIDGENITLQFKGKLTVSYNYQAYKNLLLVKYPDSKFDVQIVNKGDNIKIWKESGKVFYTHNFGNPFSDDLAMVGCYCVIKNERGEFIETLNITEINKMKKAAKTQNVWNEWYSEMALKSVIKRACKRHFKDLVVNIDRIDNEEYDPSLVSIPDNVIKLLNEAKTYEDVGRIWKEHETNVPDTNKFIELCTERKNEILEVENQKKLQNEGVS